MMGHDTTWVIAPPVAKGVHSGMLRMLRAFAFIACLHPLDQVCAAEDGNRYVALYQRIVDRQAAAIASRGPAECLWLADAAIGLAQTTASTARKDQAYALFSTALPDVAKKPADFHSLRGLALALSPLRSWGLITPAQDQDLRIVAARTWKAFLAAPAGTTEGDSDHNIRLAEATACAALANHFASDPNLDSKPIRQRLDSYWARIVTTGDLDEDASNYTGLGIVHAIELARQLGREEDLRSPGFRRMFERQRDLISGTGRLPEFGDGYFHLDRDAFDYLFICEYAARSFTDPTFLTVAHRLYDPEAYVAAPPDEWCRATALIGFPCLESDPSPLPAASMVNLRTNRRSTEPVADKLILRTGNTDSDAMVMLDLYAAGSHSHPSKGPSVAYYEVDGVPLFHNLGRHRTRTAIAGNLCWALPGDQAFPGVWKPDAWFTMTIPAELLNHDATGAIQIGDHLTFRTFDNRGTKRLWLDNLRLEGPAGTKLLDGFDHDMGWSRNIASVPGIDLATDPEHTQGSASQSLAWGALKAGAYSRKLTDARNLTCPSGDYSDLKIDVRYAGIRPYLHLRDLSQQIDLGDHCLMDRIGSARTEQVGHDAFGEVAFTTYITNDGRLTRRLVLTAEGALIIHDRWTAGRSHPTWNAGQLWQFYELAERGSDWFCSEDDGPYQMTDGAAKNREVRRRMLVKFATDAATSTLAERLDQPIHNPNPRNRKPDHFYTIASHDRVEAGATRAFSMVVMPHDPATPAVEVAQRIVIQQQPDSVVVTLTKSANSTVKVDMRDDGSWKVVRQ